MWIGRILLLGVGSSYICRWVLKPQRHRNYVAGWLKALRKTTGWLPRGRPVSSPRSPELGVRPPGSMWAMIPVPSQALGPRCIPGTNDTDAAPNACEPWEKGLVEGPCKPCPGTAGSDCSRCLSVLHYSSYRPVQGNPRNSLDDYRLYSDQLYSALLYSSLLYSTLLYSTLL